MQLVSSLLPDAVAPYHFAQRTIHADADVVLASHDRADVDSRTPASVTIFACFLEAVVSHVTAQNVWVVSLVVCEYIVVLFHSFVLQIFVRYRNAGVCRLYTPAAVISPPRHLRFCR